MLAEVDPELAQPSDRMRALGNGRWELKAVIGSECRHGLEKLQMLLSHRDPHLTLGGLVARLVRDGLERYDPERLRRVRRTGGGGSVDGERSESTPTRRDTKAKQRSMARANGDRVERRSEVERDDASLAAAAAGAAGRSAAKRDTEAELGRAKSAAVRDIVRRTDSAPKRHTEAERGSTESAAARDIVRRTDSAPKRHTGAERGSTKSAAVRDIVRRTDSAPKRHIGAERGSTESAAVRDIVRRTDSAPKRDTDAECGSTESAAVRDTVRGTDSAAKRHTGAECGGASPAAAPNRRGHTASAAKRLAYAAGQGAAGPGGAFAGSGAAPCRVELLWRGAGPAVTVHPGRRETGSVAPRSGLLQLCRPPQAGGAAAPATGWRSTMSCRSRLAVQPSCRTSDCVAVLTTGCATLNAMPTVRGCRIGCLGDRQHCSATPTVRGYPAETPARSGLRGRTRETRADSRIG